MTYGGDRVSSAPAVEKLADGDVFHSFGADRRQGLWKVRGPGEAPLPLFADRPDQAVRAEGIEPDVELRVLTDGREVIENYRALQLSLRAHPLTFVRGELAKGNATKCADLATIRDGRHLGFTAIILVRQKPGSAKAVLFITIEDETGIAKGNLWPDRFERQRRSVMSASMIAMKGRVLREGEVIRAISDRIIGHDDLLHRVGETTFPHRTGRRDSAKHAGSPDRGDKGWSQNPRNCSWPSHADGMTCCPTAWNAGRANFIRMPPGSARCRASLRRSTRSFDSRGVADVMKMSVNREYAITESSCFLRFRGHWSLTSHDATPIEVRCTDTIRASSAAG